MVDPVDGTFLFGQGSVNHWVILAENLSPDFRVIVVVGYILREDQAKVFENFVLCAEKAKLEANNRQLEITKEDYKVKLKAADALQFDLNKS